MARYDHLPIWKAALELAVATERAAAHFPRSHKPRRVGTPCPRVARSAMPTIDVRVAVYPRGHGVPTLRMGCAAARRNFNTQPLK